MSEPLQERECRHCQTKGPHFVQLMNEGKHYARVDCCGCERFLGWLPKPDADKAKRPANHRAMVQKFSRGYCEMCLTPEGQLPKGEALEAHHVDPYKDGGEPTRENCWILCTACHSLFEWRKTYQKHVRDAAAKMTAWRDDEPAPF